MRIYRYRVGYQNRYTMLAFNKEQKKIMLDSIVERNKRNPDTAILIHVPHRAAIQKYKNLVWKSGEHTVVFEGESNNLYVGVHSTVYNLRHYAETMDASVIFGNFELGFKYILIPEGD